MSDCKDPRMPIVVSCNDMAEVEKVVNEMTRLGVTKWIHGSNTTKTLSQIKESGFPVGILPIEAGFVLSDAIELFYQVDLEVFLTVSEDYNDLDSLYDFFLSTRECYVTNSICIR